MLPFDLHVLSLPLAFILSQDQTLHSLYLYLIIPESTISFSLLKVNPSLVNFKSH